MICNCECHADPENVKHLVACCVECQLCKQNIVGELKDHYPDCPGFHQVQLAIEKKVQCTTCGADTTNDGTKKCDVCWEFEKRIDDYLTRGKANALAFITTSVGKHVQSLRAGEKPSKRKT